MKTDHVLFSILFTKDSLGNSIKREYFSNSYIQDLYTIYGKIKDKTEDCTIQDLYNYLGISQEKEDRKELYRKFLKEVEVVLKDSTVKNLAETVKLAIHHRIYRNILDTVVTAINTSSFIEYPTLLTSIQQLEDVEPVLGSELIDYKKAPKLTESARMVPTGLDSLDKALDGGHAEGEYGLLVGDTKSGKSALITLFGINAALAGESVIVFLHELSKREQLRRMDRNMGDNKAELLEVMTKNGGELLLYDLSSETTSPSMLRHIISHLRRQGRRISVVCNDYLDEMIPNKGHGDAYTDQGSILLDNKRTAKKLNLVWWDATQAVRGAGQYSGIITPWDTGDSYLKARRTNVWISLNQTEREKTENYMRLYLGLFTRGHAPRRIPIGVDFERMRAWDI